MTFDDVYQAVISLLSTWKVIVAVRKSVIQMEVVHVKTDPFLVDFMAPLWRNKKRVVQHFGVKSEVTRM